jgi:uncharacterized membrane protein (UPF0182 family)
LAVAYGAARIYTNALWFRELGQENVYERLLVAQGVFALVVMLSVAVFTGANLAVAWRSAGGRRSRAANVGIVAIAIVIGRLFASAARGDYLTFLLWEHRQQFGATDPIFHKDIGFFVFTIPLELFIWKALVWLVAVTIVLVAVVYAVTAALRIRPLRASFRVQVHLAGLAATLLVLAGWRLLLQRYLLELGQPASGGRFSFSGADYVDVRVRMPGLTALAAITFAIAASLIGAPFIARARGAKFAGRLVAGLALVVLVAAGIVGILAPDLVQRIDVNPNPLLREQPYLQHSISATRAGLGLDEVDMKAYEPTGTFRDADISTLRRQLASVPTWDTWLLGPRMRQLATNLPYYRPATPTLAVSRVDGRQQPTVVGERELDLHPIRQSLRTWSNAHLAYTHGLGIIRYSATAVDAAREPSLLGTPGIRQPRIYFGRLPSARSNGPSTADVPQLFRDLGRGPAVEAPWVVADTRRPEVDTPGSPQVPYHYTGDGGIQLSNWLRRAAFALSLHSKNLLLSHDITSESRLMLHRDVADRLHTLAPFIHWDHAATPLTTDGHIEFLVAGYSMSTNYPYGQTVDVGGESANYVRASVYATVDAFSGQVELYLTDDSDPIARAWAAAFPTLFHAAQDMPPELRQRLRYPEDLFDAQAAAFETFHTTRPDVFASGDDTWAPPIALSGPIEVAGGVDFDQSDEDDLRLTMKPTYTVAAPPGQTGPRLVIHLPYAPTNAQNLAATLSGWVDQNGHTHLGGWTLPHDAVTLGPAQTSRVVFATPRVSNLLGLRNLEVRDLDKSSIDSVILGYPHLLFLPGGVVQIQSLYEGSRGPGAARLLGVTAYMDGHAGLGPDIETAVRQALNKPPRVQVVRPHKPLIVGTPTELTFQAAHARKEVITIQTAAGTEHWVRRVVNGQGILRWTPTAAGPVQVRMEVFGLDGTHTEHATALRVLSPAPTVRLVRPPAHAQVGRPIRLLFNAAHGHRATARVSSHAGIVFIRHYLLHNGSGVLRWTPNTPGRVHIVIGLTGHQGQTASTALTLHVDPRPPTPAPPSAEFVKLPTTLTVGVPSRITITADNCTTAITTLLGPNGETHSWTSPCPVRNASFVWTPTQAGQLRASVRAGGPGDRTAEHTVLLTIDRPPAPPRPGG